MISHDVYKSIRLFIYNHDHKFENVFVHKWEADSFSVTKSAYSYEIEVKVSRSDFFADFKKPKHHFFKNIKNGYSVLPGDLSWRCYGWPEVDRYPDLKDFKSEYRNIKPMMIGYKNCPNKFFYACPVGLVEIHEVPDYAGLIYVMDNGESRVIKKAPYLHKDPFIPKEMLFQKYVNLSFDNKQKIRELESIVKRLKNEAKIFQH